MVQYMNKNSGFAQWNANKNASEKKSPFSGFLWWFMIFVGVWWILGALMAPKTTEIANDATPQVDISAVPVVNLENEDIKFEVQGLRISDIELKKFNVSASDKVPVTLLADKSYAEFGLVANGTTAPNTTTIWTEKNGAMTWRNSDGVEFTRTITTDQYTIQVSDTIKNNTGRDLSFAPYGRIARTNDVQNSAGVSVGAIAYENNDLERIDWRKMDKRSFAYTTTTGFIGFADQYWETVLALNVPDQTMTLKKTSDIYGADVVAHAQTIAPGATGNISYVIYTGPLEPSALGTANKYINGIDNTIDYGWFGFLARPMLWFINALNSLVLNYGVAIILMTLILRMLMWPLTRKSYTSMIAMQKMQPEMQRIQKLYANDKMRLQMEMMKLYQTHKTSPMSGCLPMLIQIPIFFALYKALLVSVQMRSANFLWISDLAVMDPYFILPILMGATRWLQQYLQSPSRGKASNQNDITAQTQKMMRWMPVLFTIMFAWMPAGLVLYWTVSNIFGIMQMYVIKKAGK